jgi:peptide/nickel transport system substrate-binding protein
MKHIRWQMLIALAGITFLSVVLGFLAFSTTTVERPDFGGTYIEGIAGRPNAINPLFSQYNDVDRDLAALVFTGLTRADENGVIRSDLASRWSISPDGLVYTFTLRADVRWHDGVRLSADDILYTIHSIQDPAYKGPPDLGGFWRTVAITEVDSATIRFQLTQAYAPFLNYTTIGILPAHVLKDVPPGELVQNPFNRRPIGTGPFKVSEFAGDSLILDVNQSYYGPRPYLSRIQFRFYPDYESVLAAFGRGEVEGIARILPPYLPKARALNHLTLYNARLGGYTLIFLNLSKVPFQDKQVRQAFLYAIDRKRLINDLLQGQGLVAASPIEPESWAYDPAVNQYPFDVEKARALLDAAGWKDTNGDGVRRKDQVPLAFTLITNDDPARVALANEISKAWQVIGVKAVVQPVPASLLVQNVLRPRQFDAVLYEWRTLSSDPDQYENWHETQIPNASNLGQNYSGFKDRDISETLEAARKTNDQGKRAELYRKFQERFADLAPALLLFYPVYTYGVDDRVHGIQLAPMTASSDRFRNVAQWYLKTKRIAFNVAPEEATAAPTEAMVATPSGTPSTTQCADLGAMIKFPAMDSTVSGLIEIRGTAQRPNMTYWKLEYRPDADPTYAQLYRSERALAEGVLSLWSTKTVPNGVYWLQLSVADNTGNLSAPCQIRVNVAN